MLTTFFEKNKDDEQARKYLYREFPEHYVWNSQGKLWTKRKKQVQIGRINSVNPREGERYYLRLLLNHVRGPRSFDDLLSFNNDKCKTFKESAQERGLLEADNSLSECLDDAANFQMPSEFRRLFATILVHCEPNDVKKLWDDNFHALSDDLRRQGDTSTTNLISKTLSSINVILESMGKSISDYALPRVQLYDCDSFNKREIADELNIITPPEDLLSIAKLNGEQRNAYNNIIERINQNQAGVFFVDGPGGTGKTFLYRAILATLRTGGKIAIATATSGVAAAIMPGGRTAHSRFKIPIVTTESSVCNISKQSGVAELLRRATLIIWDEAPMSIRTAIESLDRTLKDLMNCDKVFGGKVIIFGGDFRQVLPVIPRARREQTVASSLVKSYLWQYMEIIQLQQNMRARSDPFFSDFLLRIGNGEEPVIADNLVHIPNEMIIEYINDEVSENALLDSVFPSLHELAYSPSYITGRAILAAKNEYVDSLNDKMIARFSGEEVTYFSFDSAIEDTHKLYQEEFLNSLTPNGLPTHKLVLKKNCPIILLRNLDPSQGLCNGTRMICRDFKCNVIFAEISTGQYTGRKIFLPRIPLCPTEDENYPFKFKRK